MVFHTQGSAVSANSCHRSAAQEICDPGDPKLTAVNSDLGSFRKMLAEPFVVRLFPHGPATPVTGSRPLAQGSAGVKPVLPSYGAALLLGPGWTMDSATVSVGL